MERRWVEPGTLYLVGTPIGNLADASPRALAVLGEVDLICAEDTRVSGRWLRREGIATPLQSFHEHSGPPVLEALLDRLSAGAAIALISDAGLPAVSDPGTDLVAQAWQRGIRVVPIPGPNAAMTAFMAAGFPLPVTVWGFLHARGRERRRHAELVAAMEGTQVLYEAPHRLRATLDLLVEVADPNRPVLVARELTKLYEELWRGTLQGAQARFRETEPRGEFTLVLGPRTASEPVAVPWDELVARVETLTRDEKMPPAEACRQVAQTFHVPRRELYRRWQATRPTRPNS
jgi:16S rRNA (cytidine1402-2'-O)-methyltransferase